jgi:hypothetical protein
VDGLLFGAFIKNPPAFIYTTGTLGFWEGDEGRSISPDTGQHGGCAFFKRAAYSPTPAGKLVPGTCSCFIHNEKSINDFASIYAGLRLRLCLCC